MARQSRMPVFRALMATVWSISRKAFSTMPSRRPMTLTRMFCSMISDRSPTM